jgi:uncharacterized protein (TIGR02001 family)
MKISNNSVSVLALSTMMLLGGVARAQEAAAPAPAVTFTGTAAFVTDYRFRGVSLSDRDIAGQASITAAHSSGLFIGLWGSSIDPIGATATSNGSSQEIDVTAGFSKAFGAITPTVGVIGYIYPGGHDVAYYEPFVSVAGAVGPVSVTLGANYAPNQGNTTEDNIYLYTLGAVGIPNTPVTLKASVGYENGAFDYGSSSKIDYMVGADFKYKFLTVGVQYIGNNLDRNSFASSHNRKDGVVASVTAAF